MHTRNLSRENNSVVQSQGIALGGVQRLVSVAYEGHIS